jgi:transposase-like protein
VKNGRVKILRDADNDPVADVANLHAISEQTIYVWRRPFGEMARSDVKRLKDLKQENARLSKLVVQRDLEIDVKKKTSAKCGERAGPQASGGLRRRARDLTTKGLHADPHLQGDADARAAHAGQGLWACCAHEGAVFLLPEKRLLTDSEFLAGDGIALSAARDWRPWAPQGLHLPRRRPRMRVASGRPRPLGPTRSNKGWSHDLVFGSRAHGKEFRCLTVINEFTKEALAIDLAGSIRSGRLIDVLSRVTSQAGVPTYLRSGNGPEFVAHTPFKRATDPKIEKALIDPGKP